MVLNGSRILWDHWEDTVRWDMEHNIIRVNHRLTEEHVSLDSAAKMRNKLAFEVLNKDMLHLMEVHNVHTDFMHNVGVSSTL